MVSSIQYCRPGYILNTDLGPILDYNEILGIINPGEILYLMLPTPFLRFRRNLPGLDDRTEYVYVGQDWKILIRLVLLSDLLNYNVNTL